MEPTRRPRNDFRSGLLLVRRRSVGARAHLRPASQDHLARYHLRAKLMCRRSLLPIKSRSGSREGTTVDFLTQGCSPRRDGRPRGRADRSGGRRAPEPPSLANFPNALLAVCRRHWVGLTTICMDCTGLRIVRLGGIARVGASGRPHVRGKGRARLAASQSFEAISFA